ncbi:MAG: efflux RND transporter periplasmic adaptor subunit [Gammaproteobacteria bacterium]|nr:efflux RND transporter periplasmic adaptor subunit [Gammaproteobacteria bacterium]
MHRLFAILTLFLAVAAHARDGELVEITASQRAALGIVTAPLSATAGAAAIGLPATVRVPPDRERVIAAPAAGMVSRVLVALGDTVKAGQPLLELRGGELAAAQRDAAEAAAQARLAEASASRDEALFEEGIVAQSRLEATRAALGQARAHLAETRASLRLMGFPAVEIGSIEKGETLGDSVRLVAPIAGSVLEVPAMVGERVEVATPLARIAALDTLWLEIQAPVDVAARLAPGQKVLVSGTGATGRVLVIGSSVSSAQTVVVRAGIDNPGGELRLNQQLTASVEGQAAAHQWQVPTRAIVSQDGGNWVFVERPEGFAPVAVQVLSRSTRAAVVVADFTGSERLVVEGVAAVKASWQGMGGE